jgi:hypothetical protein
MRDHRERPLAPLVLAVVAGCIVATLTATVPANAGHGGSPPSAGIYRIPYADGTALTVSWDAHNHGGTVDQGNDRIDMVADSPPATVVAAASGVVMAIVDIHGDSDIDGDGLGAGDGNDVNGGSGQLLLDGVTAHTDALEHSCQDASADLDGDGDTENVPDSAVIGLCQNYNNYIWIAHPNGEWSKYTHMATGTISGAPANLAVGDTVVVGQTLGIEADIGRAGGRHLHHEIAVPTTPTDTTPFQGPFIPGVIPGGGNLDSTGMVVGYYAGGFIQGTNFPPTVCDIPNNTYVDGMTSPGSNSFTADPCANSAPTADAGGPYVVEEGSTVQLDGTASSDPENAILSYSWSPATGLDDATIARPTYSGVDDTVDVIELTVSDVGGDVTAAAALTDTDETTVTVQNVPPDVTAVGDAIDEGGTATVSAEFTDPGTLDTHTASIDWGYGAAPQAVTLAQLAAGVEHVYGDDGDYDVTVFVADDDGGVGSDTVVVSVDNLDPALDLDTSGQIAFPGGDFFVVEAGEALALSAEGEDPGSDDLTFTWSTGDVSTVFNDGTGADPDLSPGGSFPFFASDHIDAISAEPGALVLTTTLTDDDGGSDGADAGVIVTGTADDAESAGWWKHQYADGGAPHVEADTAQAYLDIVDAVSSVFSEQTDAASPAAAHAVLSPTGSDLRARATADLLLAWLQFASGAVEYDATVVLRPGESVDFLDLMFAAEEIILDPFADDAQLQDLRQDLARVVHAD